MSEDEWAFVRHHTLIGERILGGLPGMETVASIVRSSHERWDGQGYPDGIAGRDIPRGARIIAVADAFCAMTEHRSYRAARPREEAVAELRACSGTQFDPEVVDAFADLTERRERDLGAALAIGTRPTEALVGLS